MLIEEHLEKKREIKRICDSFTEFSYSEVEYYRPQPEIPFDVETEGSWAPQGHAIDLRASLNYNVRNNIDLGLEFDTWTEGPIPTKLILLRNSYLVLPELQYAFKKIGLDLGDDQIIRYAQYHE